MNMGFSVREIFAPEKHSSFKLLIRIHYGGAIKGFAGISNAENHHKHETRRLS
jgi:hypothetical protein